MTESKIGLATWALESKQDNLSYPPKLTVTGVQPGKPYEDRRHGAFW